jgi:3-oxoacyl-[acyl-carrier-protein] synthase-1
MARESVALAVTGIGMVTPLGLDAWESCASLRAGLSLMQDLDVTVENDWFDDVPVVGCPVSGLTDELLGLARWTRLAGRALEDLLEKSALDRESLARLALWIALPPPDRPGTDERLGRELARRLEERLAIAGLAQRARVIPEGHAAAIKALAEAREQISAGAIDGAIVGGVDSLIEPETLEGLLAAKRLKTEDHVDGMIPGEAAAFFLVEKPERAAARKARVLARIDGVGLGEEEHTIDSDQPSAATGLSDAIEAALLDVPKRGATTGLLVGDLTGESYRAKEFGTMVSRALSHLEQQWTLWHPADGIGDTGAASAAVATCMAARAIERGHAPGARALVFAGSDHGLRGAVSLAGREA